MANAISNVVTKTVLKTGTGKALTEGVEQLVSNATKKVTSALPEALAKKATASVSGKVGLLADSLPTGQLTIGAKQVDSFEQLAKEMGEGDNPIIALIKGLFSKAKERSLTVTSKEAAEGVGKELGIILAEGEKTIAKVETNSSFIGEVAETLKKLKTDKAAKRLVAVKDSLTPEALAKLKSFMKECPYPTAKDLKKVFPDCSDEFLNKILAKMDGAKELATEAADHAQQLKIATLVKNAPVDKAKVAGLLEEMAKMEKEFKTFMKNHPKATVEEVKKAFPGFSTEFLTNEIGKKI